MNAGQFNAQISIQKRTRTPSATGPIEEWVEQEVRWCRVVPLRMNARMQFQQPLSTDASHTLRFRGYLNMLNMKDYRFVEALPEERIFLPVQSPRLVVGGKRFSHIVVKEFTSEEQGLAAAGGS